MFSQALRELERVNFSRDEMKNIMKVYGKFLSDSGNFVYKNVSNDDNIKMGYVYFEAG